jgi:hypothetical protein
MSDVLVLNIEKPKARTRHACDNCYRIIEPGETYEKQHNVYDGRAYTFKCCAHCLVAMKRAQALAEYELDDMYWGSIESALCDYRQTVADLRLLVNYRRKWRDQSGNLVAVPVVHREVGGGR